MLHLKLLFGLCLVTICIFADNISDVSGTSEQLSSEESAHQIETATPGHIVHESILAKKISDGSGTSEQLSSEDSEHQIDTAVPGHAVYESIEFESRAEDSDEDKCEAPNGLGLKNLLQQVNKLLPKTEIKKIIESYSQDPEIIALRVFARSPETRRKLKIIKDSREFHLLKDYICRILHLNLETYHNIARNLINPSSTRADNSERTAIKRLLKAIEAIIPQKKLRELYENLMKTDDELVKAVANLKSDEFHQLLLKVKNLPEYHELRKQLVALGVPIDERRDLLAKALGWSNSVDVLF